MAICSESRVGGLTRQEISEFRCVEETFEFITPEIAKEYLDCNTNNYRAPSMATVNKYADDMAAGRWTVNSACIAFVKSGILSDGQQRLLAVVKSGVGVWMYVKRNLPNCVLHDPNQDKGKQRQVSTLLARMGTTNANNCVASIRVLYRLAMGLSVSRRGAGNGFLSDSAVIELVAEMPEDFTNIIKRVVGCATIKSIYAPSHTVAALMLCFLKNPMKIDAFCDILGRKLDASGMHPANVLREYVSINKKTVDEDRYVALVITAFDLHCKGELRQLIRPTTNVLDSDAIQEFFARMRRVVGTKEQAS